MRPICSTYPSALYSMMAYHWQHKNCQKVQTQSWKIWAYTGLYALALFRGCGLKSLADMFSTIHMCYVYYYILYICICIISLYVQCRISISLSEFCVWHMGHFRIHEFWTPTPIIFANIRWGCIIGLTKKVIKYQS